jgi:hypothetical protein
MVDFCPNNPIRQSTYIRMWYKTYGEIRRAFTVFQLMTILGAAQNSIILIERDSMLYEDR